MDVADAGYAVELRYSVVCRWPNDIDICQSSSKSYRLDNGPQSGNEDLLISDDARTGLKAPRLLSSSVALPFSPDLIICFAGSV